MPEVIEMPAVPTNVHPIINAVSTERRARRIPKQSIATFLGIDRSTVSDWESGERSPKLSNLYAYARAVGLELSVDGVDLLTAVINARKARGISRPKLAAAARMEIATIYVWEKKRKDPTLRSVDRCLKALDLHPNLTRAEQLGELAPPRQRKHPEAYLQVRIPGHPLAGNSQGVMREHRKVLYDKIGPGDHNCYWCGRVVSWATGQNAIKALIADHLDHNRLNNAPDNLVPSCNDCNGHRLTGETWEPWVPGTPVRDGAATPSRYRPGHAVDATDTHRRVQALIAIGWSQAKLEKELGEKQSMMCRLFSSERIQPAMADRIRDLYEQLKEQAPPQATPVDRIAASRSRNRARASGWLPPAALDESQVKRDDDKRGAGDWGTSDCVKRIRAVGIGVHRVVVP